MSKRPESITCIRQTHAEHLRETWCGQRVLLDFVFINLDHAAYNGLEGGRLVACPECTAAAIKGLTAGQNDY